MKLIANCLNNRNGMVTVITLLVLLGVGVLTFNSVINSRMANTASENYKNKIQTFYGADGLMTFLAQEMIDSVEDNYLVNVMNNQNIGGGSLAGGYGYNKYLGIDTVKGTGNDVGGTSDQFHFVYRKIPANCDIFVRVNTMTNSSPSAVAGLMLRENLNADAVSAFVYRSYTSSANIQLKTRRTPGAANIVRTNNPAGFAEWIRIKRAGRLVIAYRSDDGSVWKTVGSDSVTMSDSIYAGFAVCSHSSSTNCITVFKDMNGLVRRSCTDSIMLSFAGNTYVKYSIDEVLPGVFSMETMGYKKLLQDRGYVTTLSQTLSRKRTGDYFSSVGDSVMIPVTLYDYRGNMTNPEFMVYPNYSNYSELHGLVQSTLDTDRKPIPTVCSPSSGRNCILSLFRNDWYTASAAARCSLFYGVAPWYIPKISYTYPKCDTCIITHFGYPENTCGWWFSDSLRKWFRPDRAPGAVFDPITGRWSNLKNRPKPSGSYPNEWVGMNYDSTKPYANIVIYDSLKFREIPPGSGIFVFGDSTYTSTVDRQWYVFGCSGPSEKKSYKFMPLKNRGFKADAPSKRYFPIGGCVTSSENFCFSMEIHRKFTYKKGQRFTFKGDDDVWVFINNKLVIDLGGTHQEAVSTVSLDTVPGLVEGDEYWFDFFYCERLIFESNIYITTNLLMFVPPLSNKRSWRRDYGSLD